MVIAVITTTGYIEIKEKKEKQREKRKAKRKKERKRGRKLLSLYITWLGGWVASSWVAGSWVVGYYEKNFSPFLLDYHSGAISHGYPRPMGRGYPNPLLPIPPMGTPKKIRVPMGSHGREI